MAGLAAARLKPQRCNRGARTGIIRRMNRDLIKAVLAIGIIVAAGTSVAEGAGAADTAWPMSAWPAGEPSPQIEPSTGVESAHLSRVPDLLIHAISLIGVQYKFGGDSAQSGFDCSGFVRHVFAQSLALQLPRSSYAIAKQGVPVEKDDLQPGDLVFYNTLRRSFSHVGIYLGENRFVHSPSRGKSVEIVDMTENYWKKRFNGARRLVSP